MRRELGSIEDALKGGKISAKDAFAAMNQVRSRYGDEDIAGAKLGEESYKTDVGAYSDEATRRSNLSVAREKLNYDRQSDLLDRLIEQDKAAYTRAKEDRDYALSLGKYDLDEREFAGLQAHRATQAQEAEQRLGTQGGQLMVAAENAQTNASQEIRNMWKDVFEGSIPKAAAVKASIEKYGVDRAMQFDPEALAVIQDYQANPTPENKAKGDEMLKKLGYYLGE
jgi:hypothetical protein